MAGLMTWFQVTCPKCTGALQVRLPEGVTSVQCSQCKAVFAVQVQPVALSSTAGSAPAAKRSRKRKKDSGAAAAASGTHAGGAAAGAGASQAPRALSAYNVFMKGEVAKVKQEHPKLAHREAFKLAAERWQSSPMNPQNGGDRFPLKFDAAKGGEDAAAAAGGAEEGAGEEEMGEDGEDDPAADDDDAAEAPLGMEDAAAAATGTGDAGGEGEGADGAAPPPPPTGGEGEPMAA